MRRHLMKASGEKLPAWFKEHIVCWYSPKRQRATNESLMADPTLVDLSGKGNDATIYKVRNASTKPFNEVCYCQADGSLQFTVQSFAICNTRFKLADSTVIADRDLSQPININSYPCVAAKSAQIGKGAFVMEEYGSNEIASFGCSQYTAIERSRNVSVLSTGSYNGKLITAGNTENDSVSDVLYINAIRMGRADTIGVLRLYSFLLFDVTLTDEQIQWVKDNLID